MERRPEDRPLSEGKRVARDIDRLFKEASGSGRLIYEKGPKALPATPMPSADQIRQAPLPSAETPEILAGRIESYMTSFVVGRINIREVRQKDRRKLSEKVRKDFGTWKDGFVRTLHMAKAPQEEVEHVRGMTLHEVAAHARKQAEQFTKEVGQATPGTKDYRIARFKSNYWRDMADFLGPAADED